MIVLNAQATAGVPVLSPIPGGVLASARVYFYVDNAPASATVSVAYHVPGDAAPFVQLAKANPLTFANGIGYFDMPPGAAVMRLTFAGWSGDRALTMWVDSQSIPHGAWEGLRALITQPYTEANVKNGVQYNLRAAWPLGQVIPTNEARLIWFKTNAKPVLVKLRQFQYIAEEMRIELFVGPTGVAAGTDLSIHNYNGVNPVATTVQAKKNVTVTGNGTPFDTNDPEYFFGSANDPQRQSTDSIPLGRERVLPSNTEFLVIITNTGTGNARAQYFLDWYEGGTDLPL